MFKRALEADLTAIFGVKKIIFNAVERTIEQDCLCVDLQGTQPVVIKDGEEICRVRGALSIKGSKSKNPLGFLTKQIAKCPPELENRFWFSRAEEPVSFDPYGWELKAYKLQFIYFYKAEYNPPRGFIETVKFLFNRQ